MLFRSLNSETPWILPSWTEAPGGWPKAAGSGRQPTPVFLPGESQGRGSLVGCRLWGRTRLKRLSSSRSNIDTDVENRFVDKGSGAEDKGEMNGDCSTEAYTLPYVKQIAKPLLSFTLLLCLPAGAHRAALQGEDWGEGEMDWNG